MVRPRIEEIELHTGCHDEAWELRDGPEPIVIAGPNGAGKTTWVEGLLSCLLGPGPHRVTPLRSTLGGRAGGERHEEWARARIGRGDASVEIRRDLRRGAVSVRSAGSILYEGKVDTRTRPYEARRHRQLLADLIGVPDRATYLDTLFVRQGALPATRLGDHLFRVATGGHARLDEARRSIAADHREVTARPIEDPDDGARDAQALEQVEAEIADLEHRLEAARAAGARRGPLTLDRDRMGQRVRQLAAEIDLLEEVHAALARGSAIEIGARQVKELSRNLEQVRATLRQAEDALAAAVEDATAATAEGRYPPDLPERLARASIRWRDMERMQAPVWPAWLAGLAVVAAIALFIVVPGLWPGLIGVAMAVAAGAVWLTLVVQDRRARHGLRQDVADALDGVPGGDRLGREDLDATLARFHAQRQAEARKRHARTNLAAAIRRGRTVLRQTRLAGVPTSVPGPESPTRNGAGRGSLGPLLARVESALESVNEQLLRERREMERVGDASLRLPDGVVPTEPGVAEALRDRRAERRRVEAALQEAGQELLERGTPAESLDALEAGLASLRPRRAELLRKARVLESAHALLSDGYTAFREHDQDRLVRLVSDQARRLTDGALGPLVVQDDLESARVRAGERVVSPTAPPLSFGDLHALLLGVRLGAAEFLGAMGVYPPLILDDPFAHLDPDRARTLWRVLQAAGRDRQVIVTTQDTLLLAELGVEPDIVLDAPQATRSDADAVARSVTG